MNGRMVLLVVYVIMNLIGLFIMGEDKKRARKHEYRISERTLWLVALFGGAVGSTIGMQLYRHKTKHAAFKIGFPFLAVIELILFIKVWW
ncbi:uncharacterized membrane protein YsdA (DUF1294 family) [Bacillus sp. SORGH_AS 510]|uniref:DUF1294 domain-containing protein n=1 Tax=Bacillus sp. SORGH_AS_0510 TaxID=3041771 RepID=UPI00277EB9F5|nr:DUF1294 domain-containing protein [Bacillus sp. SORGH_AS_0510]MDQ1144800.1 uncharacterized membrane protein YsdA (DUF1294 family) [Bacillus sp. SORGH_AS_0510]